MRRIVALLCALALLAPARAMAATPATRVAIDGANWRIDAQLTAQGTNAQGLVLTSRMIQGVFDDENPATVGNWAYPDTGAWDPQRNTDELVAAIPSYAASGLKMITVGLQGGCPKCDSSNGQNVTTAFNPDGSLKPAWMSRLDRVLRAADAAGVLVDVSLSYYKQSPRLASDAAARQGVLNVIDWLVAGGYANVLVEVANECNIGGFWPSLACDPAEIAAAQQRSGGALKVSTSYTGGRVPDAAVVAQEDFVTLHGNGQSASGVQAMVTGVQAMAAYQANPKPIVFDEDSTAVANLDAAVGAGASWGYYDQGTNDYADGYQSPPVQWAINTPSKRAFFSEVARLTGAAAPTATPTPAATASATATPGGQSITGFTLIDTAIQAPVPGYDPIPPGATIDLATSGTSLNIRANTAPATVGSVVFGYDGVASYHTENVAPYDIPSDTNGAYNPFTPTLGAHTLTATAYAATNGSGTKGGSLTITFTVVDATPTPLPAPTATPTLAPVPTATATAAPTATPTLVPTATATAVPPTSTATVAPTATVPAAATATPTATPLAFGFTVTLDCTYDAGRATPVACTAR